MSRRLVAGALVAVLLVACSGSADEPSGGRSATPSPPASQTSGRPGAGPDAGTEAPAEKQTGRREPARRARGRGWRVAEITGGASRLARILGEAERAVRHPGVAGRDLAAAAHSQQRVYRALARRPGAVDRVIRAVPGSLRPAVRNNLDASSSLGSLVSPQRDLPDWRIVNPPPADRLLAHYRAAAAVFDIPWQYLAAINLVETRMGRIRGRSTAGAQGPMQFMPATWDAYGRGDINDPRDAIMAAARYLAASGGQTDIRGALWAYNHSDHYVDAVAAYARNMRADERAYRGYYHWQVYYRTVRGDVLLLRGYRPPR